MKSRRVKRPRVPKEPSLLRKMVEAWVEIGQVHRARRLLCGQEWSIDFLVMLMRKASLSSDVKFVLRNKYGQELSLFIEQAVGIDLQKEHDKRYSYLDTAQLKTVLDQMYKAGMM